jgi:hypothetical protein
MKTNYVLPHCTTAAHAEMARNTAPDEPCDDARSGISSYEYLITSTGQPAAADLTQSS